MIDDVSTGTVAVFTIATGFKIAIFLAVLALSFLADAVSKKKDYGNQWLNVAAVFFLLGALVEFFHVISHAGVRIFAFLESHEVTKLVVNSLMIVAGLGLLWYLDSISKNLKKYR